jgi:hypothetical protein
MDIKLTYDQANQVTVAFLKESMLDIEAVGSAEDISTWDAIQQTLAYISSPEDLQDMEQHLIPSRWVDIILRETFKVATQ